MPFQVGINLPPGTWQDYHDSTSLGSNLLRLVGSGLTDIGGVVRKDRYHADDIRLKEADDARQASQFDRTLAENHAQHQAQIDRWDADRAAKQSEDNAPYEYDEKAQRWLPKASDVPLTFPTKPGQSVPQAMAERGQSEYVRTSAPEDPKYAAQNAELDRTLGTQAPASIETGGSRTAPSAPVRPFLRRKNAMDANAELDKAAVRDATQAFRTQTDAEQKARADRLDRQEKESEAARAVAVRAFRDPTHELTPDEEAIVAKDPSTLGLIQTSADRRERRLFQEKAAAEKQKKAAEDEASTLNSAVEQFHQLAARGSEFGIKVDVPTLVSKDGKPLMTAKEAIRRASVAEKNYDDAFHAQAAERTALLVNDKTMATDRRRTAQHQVDAFTKQMSVQKKALDKIQADIQLIQGFPGQEATVASLRKTESDALDAFNRTVRAQNSAYKVIGRLVGFENIVDPETGQPMAEVSAQSSPGPQSAVIPDEFPTAAAAKEWLKANSAGLAPEDVATLEEELASRVKKSRSK